MAEFTIKIDAKPIPEYEHKPAIGFYDVIRGEHDIYMDNNTYKLRYIGEEPLIKNVIRNNNAIILQENGIVNNTDLTRILPQPINDINSLSKVTFMLKGIQFKDRANNIITNDINLLSPGIFKIGTSSTNLIDLEFSISANDIVEYDIQQLKNLYVTGEELDFVESIASGYIDILYTFRRDDGVFNLNETHMSVIRVQFLNIKNTDINTEIDIYNIDTMTQSEFNNAFLINNEIPIPLSNNTDFEGNVIPLYYLGALGPDTVSEGAGIKINTKLHTPGYSQDPHNFQSGDSNIPYNTPQNSSPVFAITNIIYNQLNHFDIFNIEGQGTAEEFNHMHFKSKYIFGIISDAGYNNLI